MPFSAFCVFVPLCAPTAHSRTFPCPPEAAPPRCQSLGQSGGPEGTHGLALLSQGSGATAYIGRSRMSASVTSPSSLPSSVPDLGHFPRDLCHPLTRPHSVPALITVACGRLANAPGLTRRKRRGNGGLSRLTSTGSIHLQGPEATPAARSGASPGAPCAETGEGGRASQTLHVPLRTPPRPRVPGWTLLSTCLLPSTGMWGAGSSL